MQRTWRSLVLGALVAGCAEEPAVQAGAEEIQTEDVGLAELAELSDAVFVGTAIAVEERMSQPSGDTPALPFTFVTYEVEEDIAGGLPGAQYTLRFLGGSFPDGRTLHGSHVPHVAVGDRDLLFVSLDGESAVPLVHGEKGRFPLRHGQVHDFRGAPLVDDGGRLRRGRPELDGQAVEVERLVPLLRGLARPGPGLRAVDPDAAFGFEMPAFDAPRAAAPEPAMPADEIAERQAAGFPVP